MVTYPPTQWPSVLSASFVATLNESMQLQLAQALYVLARMSHLHSYSLTHSLTLTNILTRHTEGARTTEGVEHCLALCRIGLEDLGRDLGQLHPGELVTLSDVHTHARTHYTATALHTHTYNTQHTQPTQWTDLSAGGIL